MDEDKLPDEVYRLKSLPTFRFTKKEFELELSEAQTSVYRWWYEYLRLSRDYWFLCKVSHGRAVQTTDKRFAEIYNDFGDIFKLPFGSWWKSRGRKVFRESAAPRKVRVLNPRSPELESSGDKWGSLVVEIPLSLSRRQILRQVGKEITARQEKRPGNLLATSTAKYPVNPVRFKIPTLQTMHEVYCLNRELIVRPNFYENLKKAEGFKRQSLQVDQFRIGKILHLNRDAEKLHGDNTAVSRKKNVMRATVSRYIARAEHLIANVELGRFPDFSPVTDSGMMRFTQKQREMQEILEEEWLEQICFSSLSYSEVNRLVVQDGLDPMNEIRKRYG